MVVKRGCTTIAELILRNCDLYEELRWCLVNKRVLRDFLGSVIKRLNLDLVPI